MNVKKYENTYITVRENPDREVPGLIRMELRACADGMYSVVHPLTGENVLRDVKDVDVDSMSGLSHALGFALKHVHGRNSMYYIQHLQEAFPGIRFNVDACEVAANIFHFALGSYVAGETRFSNKLLGDFFRTLYRLSNRDYKQRHQDPDRCVCLNADHAFLSFGFTRYVRTDLPETQHIKGKDWIYAWREGGERYYRDTVGGVIYSGPAAVNTFTVSLEDKHDNYWGIHT